MRKGLIIEWRSVKYRPHGRQAKNNSKAFERERKLKLKERQAMIIKKIDANGFQLIC